MQEQLSGLVLCGGEGQRMDGRDKGWVMWHGVPLVEHVLKRLRPQVTNVLISANRHAARYADLGAEVFGDSASDVPYPGPLAGIAAALARAHTG